MILYPTGNKEVVPTIRPDISDVSVEVVKSVDGLTVAPNKFAPVKTQYENIVPVRSIPDRSIEVNVRLLYLVPLPIISIVISVTDFSLKFVVLAIVDVTVTEPIPFTVTVPTFPEFVIVTMLSFSEE
jgi:hypothetical protein